MKKSLWIAIAGALAVSVAVALAQEVLSANTIGYIKKELPAGGKLITVSVPLFNMTAAKFNGFAVEKYFLFSFLISGMIAGLGGSAEILGTQFFLINGYAAGYGFDGVSMALIGQLHPIATMLVAIFFAALRVGSTTMQAATGVPTSVSDIIQALVIVFTVADLAMVKLPEFRAAIDRAFAKK